MKIGFIGLGRMGEAMAERLIGAGFELVVYNRTAAKLQPLLALGAQAAASPAQAAEAGLVISMLADDAALQAVTSGEGGLLEALPEGGVHVAMGTHDVRAIRSAAQAHRAAGAALVCAPVLGRPEAVRGGKAAIVAGGPSAALERARPALEALGRRVFEAGEDPGSAAAMKLANNFLLASAIEALGEAFALAEKSGVDRQVFREMITDGLFASPAYDIYSRLIADRGWDKAGFTVTLALKDVELAMSAGGAAGAPLPMAGICRDRLLSAIAHGGAELDWSAMALEQARASGLV